MIDRKTAPNCDDFTGLFGRDDGSATSPLGTFSKPPDAARQFSRPGIRCACAAGELAARLEHIAEPGNAPRHCCT